MHEKIIRRVSATTPTACRNSTTTRRAVHTNRIANSRSRWQRQRTLLDGRPLNEWAFYGPCNRVPALVKLLNAAATIERIVYTRRSGYARHVDYLLLHPPPDNPLPSGETCPAWRSAAARWRAGAAREIVSRASDGTNRRAGRHLDLAFFNPNGLKTSRHLRIQKLDLG